VPLDNVQMKVEHAQCCTAQQHVRIHKLHSTFTQFELCRSLVREVKLTVKLTT